MINLPVIMLATLLTFLIGAGIYVTFVPFEPEVVKYCPPEGTTGSIVGMEKVHSGKSTYYHISVGYEQDGAKQLCLGSVDSNFFNYFKEGDKVRPIARLIER